MRKFWGAAAVLAVLATTGCVTAEPPPAPEPTDVSEAPFASEEEALAAAEEAYVTYLAAVDTALQNLDASGLDEIASGSALQSLRQGVEAMSASAERQTGRSELMTIEAADASALTFYACVDLTGVDIQTPDGSSTVNPLRKDHMPMYITFDIGATDLVVTRDEVWESAGVC